MSKEELTMKHEGHTDCYFVGGMYDGIKKRLLSGTKEFRVRGFRHEDIYQKVMSINDDVAIFCLKSDLIGCVVECNELKTGEE